MVQDRIYSYFERNPQLHVLFIFDDMAMISNELEGLEWQEGYRYVVFDGAWFNAKYNIEQTWKNERVVLLFPNRTSPRTENDQIDFPLMDILKANIEYKDDGYASFMQQYGIPERFAPFIKKHIAVLTSSKLTTILGDYFRSDAFSIDTAIRGIISGYLGNKKLLDWAQIIAKLIALDIDTEKKRTDFYYRLKNVHDIRKALETKLTDIFGFSYSPNSEQKMRRIAESLKYNALTQLIDLSPVDDYKQYKLTSTVNIDNVNRIIDSGLGGTYADKFREAMKLLASDIREDNIIRWYGIDAQYFYMTEQLAWPILREAIEKLYADPKSVSDLMHKLQPKYSENHILTAIHLLDNVALYYESVRGIDTLRLNTPNEYISRYTTDLYRIDLYYRHSIDNYYDLISVETPIDDIFEKVKKRIDQDYAKFANVLNLEWIACVKEQPGMFSNISIPRQQNFYHDEVDKGIKIAVIISDAFRYEVAQELMEELTKPARVATIHPMLAMLPTVTKYCKPALLPHRQLSFQTTGVWADSQPTNTIEERTALLKRFQPKAACIDYKDIAGRPIMALRDYFKQHKIVYIFHDVIDDASHKQNPYNYVRACQETLKQLRNLINTLHSSWSFYDVVLTSDHGFIYNDMDFEEKDKHNISDTAIEKKTRYYITTSSTPHDGISKFPLAEVSALESPSPLYIAVPNGTNRMAAPGGYAFAHGGASLQEMIVPVIHSKLKKSKNDEKPEKVGVALVSRNLNMVSSRLKFQLIQSEAVSAAYTKRTVVCQLFDDTIPVTDKKSADLESTDKDNLNKRIYEITLDLNKSVSSSILQLRVYDSEDTQQINPLIKENVKNNTLIEQDF